MAKALTQGRPLHRRAMFGLFDADGWGWASTKAFIWLLVLIMALGYIPDRAYYFVVSRTIDLGIMFWSPVNLCPPENGTNMPCPVPVGGVVPWQASPAGSALPQPRTDGSAAQLGTNLLYIGGTDGTEGDPAATTYVATVATGSFGAWAEGPALPEGRSSAALANLSGTAYLIGGRGPDGQPTDTVWSIGLDPDTSALGTWAAVEVAEDEPLLLPEPRSHAAAVAVTDGIVVAGGLDAEGNPTSTVWKSTLDDDGVLGEFIEQPSLAYPVADASIALEGTFLWLYGGSQANGPSLGVQRAQFGEIAAEEEGHGAAATPTPAPSGEAESGEAVHEWKTDESLNLPEARSGASGFAANGALYLVGGFDGVSRSRELYWALPDATGALPGSWRHLDVMDLPADIVNADAVTSGSTVFLLGGEGDGGVGTGAFRASLAPEEPFFQLGLLGVVVPALKIGGEIGQQLGYLAAAGVGTGNFAVLVGIAWALNHREQIRGWMERRRIAKEAKAPPLAE